MAHKLYKLVAIMTTYVAAGDGKTGIMTTLSFECM